MKKKQKRVNQDDSESHSNDSTLNLHSFHLIVDSDYSMDNEQDKMVPHMRSNKKSQLLLLQL